MTLAAGTRLGPYEIVSPLGAGGMGEVWRAKDTRLERDVAIKILPADFAANVQFKARFEREAKTTRSSIIRTSARSSTSGITRGPISSSWN